MPCFNCCKRFSKHTETRYQRPSQLTHRLQDKKGISGSHKLDITILGALENISDGEVSIDKLKRHSAHYLCHECHVYLRQAVNKKCELERHIGILNENIDKVSNDERRSYYRKNYGLDKNGRCWACMHEFVPSDFQRKHSQRLNMATTVVEEMTVGEAVDSLLEEQAKTLIGLYQKKTYICRPCVTLLRNVIKTQCHFDTLQTSFTSLTNPDSAYAQLLAGDDVPYFEDSFIDVEGVKNVEDDDERSESVQRPFHKTLGNPTLEVSAQRTTRKRKHSNDKSDECDLEYSEKDVGSLNEIPSESNEIVMNSENGDYGIIDDVKNNDGSENCAINIQTDCELKTAENDVSNAALDKLGDNLIMLNNSQESSDVKSKMQIRLNLKGSEIEAATVLEVGCKKPKLNQDEMEIKSFKDKSIR